MVHRRCRRALWACRESLLESAVSRPLYGSLDDEMRTSLFLQINEPEASYVFLSLVIAASTACLRSASSSWSAVRRFMLENAALAVACASRRILRFLSARRNRRPSPLNNVCFVILSPEWVKEDTSPEVSLNTELDLDRGLR